MQSAIMLHAEGHNADHPYAECYHADYLCSEGQLMFMSNHAQQT